MSLFSKLFISSFEQNSNQIDLDTGKIFITKAQYEASIQDIGDEDQVEHFMNLYEKADKDQKMRISRDQLLQAIKDDLRIQLDESDEDEPLTAIK